MSELRDMVEEAVDEAREELSNLVRQGMLELADGSYFGQVETTEGEVYDDVELMQHFGLAARPPAGGEAVIAHAGDGEGAIVIATNDRAHRPSGLASGDAVLYGASGSGQAQVWAKADGDIDCVPGAGKTVNVGGSSDALLKGTTFDTAMATYLNAMQSAATTWNGSLKQLADLVTYVSAHATAILALYNARIALPWLASKGKVA